ncbi:MAG: biotin transporter BioY [Synergistaceae bacterium]|jgi:biotin transport system substrate-specific component|nr:biotin transporter BioY [Synergistaceae bacterium]
MSGTEKNAAAARYWLSTKEMAGCALFAVLTGVGANVRIPLPYVPLTLQTVLVLMSGLLLGGRRAAVAMTMYMLMGLLGLPVFAGGGGFHSLLSPSFGFVVGFIPAAWVTGRICQALKVNGNSLRETAARSLACLLGVFAYDLVGCAWLYFNLNVIVGKSFTVSQTIASGLAPFLLTDAIKLVVAVIISGVISVRLQKSHPRLFSD